MPEMTLAQVEEELHGMDPVLSPDDEAYKVALVLLSSLVVGPDPIKVAQFTGLHAEWVMLIASRLQANGVWTEDGKLAVDWFDEGDGGVSFWIDVAVGQGFIERSVDEGQETPPAERSGS